MTNPFTSGPLGNGLPRPQIPSILGGAPTPLSNILGVGIPSTKRSVFVSYHHGDAQLPGDQLYYNKLSRGAAQQFQLMQDKSLRQQIDSGNHDYIIQKIRDRHITRTSCTIVLCGAHTPKRKYVDWEIKATLDKGHGIVAVYLPTAPRSASSIIVPDRLSPNINSGYAYWVSWESFTQSAANFKACIESAVRRSKDAALKRQMHNPREIKKQNG